MTKLHERVLLGTLLLLGGVFLLDLALLQKTGTQALVFLLPLLGVAAVVCLVTMVRLWLIRRVLDERREEAMFKDAVSSQSLFGGGDETAPMSMARSRVQFEGVLLPMVAPLLILLEVCAAFSLWPRISQEALSGDFMLLGASLTGQAFFLFLVSRYFMGLGRVDFLRPLGGAGAVLGLCSVASLLVAVGGFLITMNLTWAMTVVSALLWAALIFLALEQFLLWVMAWYHPRRSVQLARSFEPRWASWLADPSGWTRQMVQTVDYQFGADMAGRSGLRLLLRLVLPLFAGVAVVLFLSSSLVFIAPQEIGVLERLGKPVEGAWRLDSGFHVVCPWPLDQVRRVPAKRVVRLQVGYQEDRDEERPDVIVWTVPHLREERMVLVPSASSHRTESLQSAPVALLNMNIPVEYRVTNALSYAYASQDAHTMVERVAGQALTQEVAARDLTTLLSGERDVLASALQGRMQGYADGLGLGVEFVFVGLQGVHPPVAVAEAYQSVIGALEEKEAVILHARAYAVGLGPASDAEAAQTVMLARAARDARGLSAEAEAEAFKLRLEAYRASPETYRNDRYMMSLIASLSGARKYIVDHAQASRVLNIDFTPQATPDLLSFGMDELESSP